MFKAKKTLIYMIVCLLAIHTTPFSIAQEPEDDLLNLIDGLLDEENNSDRQGDGIPEDEILPDLNIASAQYIKEQHNVTVQVCQSQANYVQNTTITVEAEIKSYLPVLQDITIPGIGCSNVYLSLNKDALQEE